MRDGAQRVMAGLKQARR